MFVSCHQLILVSLLILVIVASTETRSSPALWNPASCPTQCVCRAESSLRKVYCDIQDKQHDLTTMPASFPDDTEFISLSRNKIATIPVGTFARLSQLRYLVLSSNELHSLPRNVFQGLTNLTSLNVANNKLSDLPSGLLSGLTSLKDLYLDGNVLEQLPSDFFTGLTSLRRLLLNNNKFHTFSEQLFGFRGEIRYFRATPAAMSTTLTPDTLLALPNLTSLEELRLNHNGIGQVQHGSFNRMSDLKQLKLNDNNISTLPKGLFRELKSLRLLSLYNNPFQCTCSLKWLKHWILQNDKKITVFYKELITCHGPPSLRGRPLIYVKDKEFACLRKQFTTWSAWSPCTKTCDGGRQSRIRNCTQLGMTQCKGNLRNWRVCNMHSCDPGWGEWSEWSPCSVTCSLGHQTRTRSKKCVKLPCERKLEPQVHVCIRGVCPHYSEWSAWSKCDQVCGQGKQTRKRTCVSPDGIIHTCAGPDSDTKTCFLRNCAEWTPWSAWTTCSKSCTRGTQSRMRNCIILNGSQEQCQGNRTEQQLCNLGKCPVHGGWSPWLPWSKCSRTCGMGYSIRYRNCSNPSPLYGGDHCKGHSHQVTSCAHGICSDDNDYTPWSSWSECSSKCGRGTQKRSRNCTRLDQTSGVGMCLGNHQMYRHCEVYHQCDRNGTWGEWSPWSQCFGNCNQGLRIRWRFCTATSSNPGYIGRYICNNNETFNYERQTTCKPKSCNYDPVWSIWSNWGQCSTTCGRGIKRRKRFCLTRVIGQECSGSHESKESCNIQGCPIDGGWSSWGAWGNCSRQCDHGLKQRNRTCTEPAPVNNGRECGGDRNEKTNCNTHKCQNYVVGDRSIELQSPDKCPEVKQPQHGKVMVKKQRDEKTYLIYKCDQYYRNKGRSKIRMCQTNGKWNGDPAECVPDCGEIGNNDLPGKRLTMDDNIMHMNESWPWQAAVKVLESKCGGSLYGDQWIITAAHCVQKRHQKVSNKQVTVYLGTNIWSGAHGDQVQVIPVENIYSHPDFKWTDYSSDIAVLKLTRKVHITSSVHPVCLPRSRRTKQLLKEGKMGVMVGWGSYRQFLRQIPLPVVSLNACKNAYKSEKWKVTNKMLCAGYKDQRRDTCKGDSGGGLLFHDKAGGKNRWILGGVVSWGYPECGKLGKYSVFTNVAKHVSWIRRMVEQN